MFESNTDIFSWLKVRYERELLEKVLDFLGKQGYLSWQSLFKSLDELIKFLEKEKNKSNKLGGFYRLLKFFNKVLSDFNDINVGLVWDRWSNDLIERYMLLNSKSIIEVFSSSFDTFPSKKRKYFEKFSKIENLYLKLKDDFKLNNWEIVIVSYFLKFINYIYFLEERKRQRFTWSSEKKPASWHFYKVVENIVDFYKYLKEKDDLNNLLLKYKKILEKYKLPILITAIFHDAVEDKRFTLPLNFVSQIIDSDFINKLVERKIYYLPPEVIFDDEEKCIINWLFVKIFDEFVSFKNLSFNKRSLNNWSVQIDEENLIKLNKDELENILRFSLNYVYSGIIEDDRILQLREDEISLILSVIDTLTQRKHGSWYYTEWEEKYRYLKEYLEKISTNKIAVLIKWSDFLDNIRWKLSEKQQVKYLKYYIPFFRKQFWTNNLLEFVPEKVKKEIEYPFLLNALKWRQD